MTDENPEESLRSTTLAMARKAFELQSLIESSSSELDKLRNSFRDLANGDKLEIVYDGLGTIAVTSPRKEKKSVVVALNEEFVANIANRDLVAKLREKSVIIDKVVTTSGAKASVSFKRSPSE
jgi:hypothetical protein